MAGRASLDRSFIWAALVDPEGCVVPADRDTVAAAAQRLADLTSLALVAALLAPLERRIGALFDPARVEKARLFARFQHRAHLRWIGVLADEGVETVCIKGFANAHAFFDEPETRISGDLDVLVRPRDLARAIAVLGARGFAFRKGEVPRWGFVSTASFAPFVSADGACNLDLHTAPDSDPLDRALDAEAVFARAREFRVGGIRFRVPSVEHALILCISNAAKDKFGAFAANKIIDAAKLLARASALDRRAVEDILRRANLMRPARAFMALLAALEVVPKGARSWPSWLAAPPRGFAAGEFSRMVLDARALYPAEAGNFAKFRREWLLAAEPRVALRLAGRRLAGLWRPASGVPRFAAGRAKG